MVWVICTYAVTDDISEEYAVLSCLLQLKISMDAWIREECYQ